VRAFDRFVEIRTQSDEQAAKRIYEDEIDILVDLKGYTTHARPGIVALRPAPVQASYLGYPGTMGADFIDYLVADRIIVPPDEARDYSETLVLLPGSYQANDRSRRTAALRSRAELGLPEDAFVFCCFNQAYKILPAVFDVWARLLKAVPKSVLWMLEGNPWARQNLIREAGRRGVAAERLVFAPYVTLEENLARLSRADLFLDTWPYNAHTTASDALWSGLPVLTCAGSTFASRVAASLLHAVGLPELVCGSLAEYESLALRLATEPERLRSLRESLARDRLAKPLFDTPEFARNIEKAYQAMWANFISGKPRAMIRL
jgi:predicted O-linked N-acetylglucosamine transferase (SPINDLY family)